MACCPAPAAIPNCPLPVEWIVGVLPIQSRPLQGLTFAELNCHAMQVDNDDAVRFYKRFGFEVGR